MKRDYTAIAVTYAHDAISGKIIAGKYIKLACQNFLDDLQAFEDPASIYSYDPDKVDHVCSFIQLMRHTRGKWATKKELIRLESWQVFFLANIFGFIERDTELRRCREVLLWVARKNGKSILVSFILLYLFCCGNDGSPEAFCGSPRLRQSMEAFTPAHTNVRLQPALRNAFGLEARAQSILKSDGGKFVPVVGQAQDGSSPTCFSVDELHELEDNQIIDMFRLGTASREESLGLLSSTAGYSISGPCYDLVQEAKQVLEGSIQRPEFFALLYTAEEADWTSEDALFLANPNIGISCSYETLKREQQNAIINPRKASAFRTKHLNIFVGANEALFNLPKWIALGDPTLKPEQFRDCRVTVGVDLSSRIDLTAFVLVFRSGDRYAVLPSFYCPGDRINDPAFSHYHQYASQGHLIATPGSSIDLEIVFSDLCNAINEFGVTEVAIDPWNSGGLVQRIQSSTSATVIEVPQQMRTLSAPTKLLEALILDGNISHDANPVMNWCMGNVQAIYDGNDNVKPAKPRDKRAKTDGASALITALSRAMLQTETVIDGFYS